MNNSGLRRESIKKINQKRVDQEKKQYRRELIEKKINPEEKG